MFSGGARSTAGFLKRCEQRLFHRHADLSARSVGFGLTPKLLAPLCYGLRFAKMREEFLAVEPPRTNLAALIVVLFGASGPATVFRRVSGIVVNAIQAMPVTGSAAHVSQEVLVQAPSGADSDASGTVVLKPSMVRVIAAAQHGSPSSVLRTFLAVASLAVAKVAGLGLFSHHLASEASTGCASFGFQAERIDHMSAGAVTQTLPVGSSLFWYNNSAHCC